MHKQPAVLSVHALGKSYGDVPVLRGVSLEVRAGTATAIMGPFRSGKSTLLHCMSGIVKPDSGAILLSGRHIENLGENDRSRLRRESYGFVFQSGQLLPELPAIENVALPLVLNGFVHHRSQADGARLLRAIGTGRAAGPSPGSDVGWAVATCGDCASVGDQTRRSLRRRADRCPRRADELGSDEGVA